MLASSASEAVDVMPMSDPPVTVAPERVMRPAAVIVGRPAAGGGAVDSVQNTAGADRHRPKERLAPPSPSPVGKLSIRLVGNRPGPVLDRMDQSMPANAKGRRNQIVLANKIDGAIP